MYEVRIIITIIFTKKETKHSEIKNLPKLSLTDIFEDC